jgi:peptidoglycan/LPS O-acetylase OafA/YrhL
MLLSRYPRLDTGKVADFYYRRIKRIFPIYLFIIFAFHLTAICLWYYPLDYEQLFEETKKPLMFISNWPKNDETNYFEQVTICGCFDLKFLILLNLWIKFLLLISKNERSFFV